MAKERLAYFDNVKGVLIVLVVIGHLVEPVANATNLLSARAVDFIYLFHMPLFIFTSGLFCKGVFRDGRYRADVPLYYLALCMTLYVLLQAERALLGTFSSFRPLTLSGGSIPWYLMALAAYVTAIPLFSRLRPAFALAGSLALAVMTGFYDPGDFLTAARICVYLPFFLLGYYMSSSSIEGAMARLAERGWLTPVRVCAALALCAAFGLLCTLGNDGLVFLKKLFTARNSYETILSSSGMDMGLGGVALLRLAYYFAVLAASTCVLALVPRRKLGPLTRAGERSLQVYFIHPMIYYGLNKLGFAKGVYALFGEPAGLCVLMLAGLALALGLAAFAGPQKAFDRMRLAVGKLVS